MIWYNTAHSEIEVIFWQSDINLSLTFLDPLQTNPTQEKNLVGEFIDRRPLKSCIWPRI